jgi:hypothetical protein
MKDIFLKELNVGDDVLVLHRSRNSSEYITTGVITKIEKAGPCWYCYIDAALRVHGSDEIMCFTSPREIKVRDTTKSIYKIKFTDEDKAFMKGQVNGETRQRTNE